MFSGWCRRRWRAMKKNTRRRVALRLSVGGKAGSGFLSRAFVLCRLRICASLCGARFFFSFSRGLLGPKHVEVHEMRAKYVVVGFGKELLHGLYGHSLLVKKLEIMDIQARGD